MALGAEQNQKFEVNRINDLKPGQIVIAGTDVICESRYSSGEMFGSDRVKGVAREKASSSSQEILESALTCQLPKTLHLTPPELMRNSG